MFNQLEKKKISDLNILLHTHRATFCKFHIVILSHEKFDDRQENFNL